MVVGVSCSVVGPKRYERWGVSLSDFAVSVDGSDLSFMEEVVKTGILWCEREAHPNFSARPSTYY